MRTFSLFFVLALGLSAAASHDWNRISDLHTGDRIQVIQTDGGEQVGNFAAVTAEGLTIASGPNQTRVERARVRKVVVLSRSKRLRNALIGVGIGFAVGLVVDKTVGAYLNNESHYSGGAQALVYLAPIGLFGGIGAAMGGHPTIYQAR
jgi:hypothetical protein